MAEHKGKRKITNLAVVVHSCAFGLMLLSHLIFPERPWLDFPVGVFFGLSFVIDLPLSLFCFAWMWGSDRALWPALIAWAIGGALWWYLLGRLLDAWRNQRRARSSPSPD